MTYLKNEQLVKTMRRLGIKFIINATDCIFFKKIFQTAEKLQPLLYLFK